MWILIDKQLNPAHFDPLENLTDEQVETYKTKVISTCDIQREWIAKANRFHSWHNIAIGMTFAMGVAAVLSVVSHRYGIWGGVIVAQLGALAMRYRAEKQADRANDAYNVALADLVETSAHMVRPKAKA